MRCSDAVRSGLPKLAGLAEIEKAAAVRDLTLLGELQKRAGQGATAIALPDLPQGADDVSTLVTVAEALASS